MSATVRTQQWQGARDCIGHKQTGGGKRHWESAA